MRSRTVKLIAAKELLDTLRDRRTLFVALVLPLLLYPALLLGLTQIIGVTQRNLAAEHQKVWIDGGEGIAELVSLLKQQKLEPVRANDPEVRAGIRSALAEMEGRGADAARTRMRSALEDQGFDVALVCGPDFEGKLDRFAQADASLLYDPTDEPSKIARNKVNKALEAFRTSKRDALAREYPGEETRLRFMEQPVAFKQVEIATSSQKGAYSFAPMLGLLIVIMALTGAFYPAVDLAAGEKERGTMETLLVAPVMRREIVMGKFVAVWVIAVVTAMLNLIVMGVTFSKLAGMIGSGSVAFSIPPSAVVAVMLILVPTSALFSALALALSSFATSYKEGQHYLSPLFLVAMPLSMVALLPNIEIGYALAFVPVANVVLLVKAMLLGGEVMGPALVATGATALYAAFGIFVAVSIFRRESVLFRSGAGRGYDAKSLEASRKGLPTQGQGVLAFFVVLALMFFFSAQVKSMADAIRAFVLAQVAVLVPPLLLARRGKLDLRSTFSIRPFPLKLVPVVVCAAACGLVLVIGAYSRLMPEPDAQGFERLVEKLVEGSPWLIFVLLAVLPPVCEEILCRGLILASFRSRFGARGAVVISAAMFGALHLDLLRFPATFAAGLLLGFVLVRTGSLFASILFHTTWNAILATAVFGGPAAGLGEAGALEFSLAALGLAGALFVLYRQRPEIDSA